MKYWAIVITALSIISCDVSEVDRTVGEVKKTHVKKPVEVVVADSNDVDLDKVHKVVDEKELENGIKIKWYSHGEGDLVKNGDMVNIDYKVFLENGEVIDGNHLQKLPSFPFMVGFQMQTESWDLALKEMKIGDFAEVFIPAAEMRGSDEIEGLIPKNSNNILKIRLISMNEPTKVIDGTRIWLMNENKSQSDIFKEDKRISFHCWVSTPSNPRYFNTEWENNPYSYSLDDSGLVPGLRKALINAKKADLMLIHIPANEAYDTKGYLDLVKPNEDLLYRVFVMEVRDK